MKDFDEFVITVEQEYQDCLSHATMAMEAPIKFARFMRFHGERLFALSVAASELEVIKHLRPTVSPEQFESAMVVKALNALRTDAPAYSTRSDADYYRFKQEFWKQATDSNTGFIEHTDD